MQDDSDKDIFASLLQLPEEFPPLKLPQGFCRFFVHMPNLNLGDGIVIPFRGGELRSVAFDEWQPLDQEIAEKRADLYKKTRPVFFVIDEENSSERVLVRIQRDVQVLFSILTLFGMRADAPATSVMYVSREKSVARYVGVHDRRSILNGPVRWRLTGIDDAFLDKVSSLDRQAAAFNVPEVARAIQACTFSEDGVDQIDAIMRLTVALEALLLEDVTTGITSAFAKRVGQYVLEVGEIANDLERDLRVLYALRSDALHGRDWTNTVAVTGRDESTWTAWAHGILLRTLNRVVNQIGCSEDPRIALSELRRSLVS